MKDKQTPASGELKPTHIALRVTEIQSALNRVRWAELLIRQLPEDHEGRNAWLHNYAGEKNAADLCRPDTPASGGREGCRYCKAKVHMSRDGSPYHVLSYFEGHELELELCVDRLPTPPKE